MVLKSIIDFDGLEAEVKFEYEEADKYNHPSINDIEISVDYDSQTMAMKQSIIDMLFEDVDRQRDNAEYEHHTASL